jgi:branched-chain amino acid transport system substrate-binding protein
VLIAGLCLACSSDSKSAGTSAGSSGSSSGTTAGSFTGPPVVIYTLTDGDPTNGSENKSLKFGLQAAVAGVNKSGGLLGHEVQLKICQSPFKADQQAQCAKDALADPNFLAFVGDATNAGEQVEPMVKAAGVPVVAGIVLTPSQLKSPNEFSLHIGTQMHPAGARVAALDGNKRIVVGTNLLEGTQGIEGLTGSLLQGTGATLTGSVSLPQGKPDLSAEVTKAASDGDDIQMVTEVGTLVRFLVAKQNLGAKINISAPALIVGADGIASGGSALDGTNITFSFLPEGEQADGHKRIKTDMEAIGQGSRLVDDFTINSWLGVQVLSQAVTKANSVDPREVLKALSQLNDVNTYGLTQPIDFTKSVSYNKGAITRIFNPWVISGTIQNGKYVVKSAEWIDVLATVRDS